MPMKVPFSPPMITEEMIAEVVDTLRSGWITTGPKTKRLETELTDYVGAKKTLCVGSATQGMELFLRWFGVGVGDEVIIPAYTYCATANVVMHVGAKPVMVDINPADLCIDIEAVRNAITPRTKAIIPVDLGGLPALQEDLIDIANSASAQFQPNTDNQKSLGRILVMTDAAHSIGASVNGKMVGSISDATVFSFHAVKNLTTAEGGAIAFNLPDQFDHDEVYGWCNTMSLHGQSKDALAKTQLGQWRYDVVEPGHKSNMTDIQASLGLVQLKDYDFILKRRKEVFAQYDQAFSGDGRFTCPPSNLDGRVSSCHFYALRLQGFLESNRDTLIQLMAEEGVSANVHYQPLPMLTAYRNLGYDVNDYPVSKSVYESEITLPVFNGMTDEQVSIVITTLKSVLDKIEDQR
ncbi:MAG: dTDP-4-amino-4,6-dideoxygalactose transaminase [Flavobacteriales bacterium]|jgi:dTDP-4-amino-4,6-dideoxygalactose transaminase